MKKCAIIANGYYHVDSMVDQIKCITLELEKLNIAVDRIYTDKLIAFISAGGVLSAIGEYDFIVFLDKDLYISHLLEKAGYNLVNSATSIELCDDKMKTYIALSSHGILMPDTIASPLNYTDTEDEFYVEVERLFGYPVVVKEVYGSMGKGVHLANDREELKSLRSNLKHVPHLYQKFVGSGGRDVRVIVISGKAVGAMERINNTDFRSNVYLGGEGRAIPLTEDLRAISENCAKILGLDYCGVDILRDGTNNYVCEVNSNAFFKEFQAVTKINVAALLAKFLDEKF